jgi:putative metallohydrolase (TIGR04338 family)
MEAQGPQALHRVFRCFSWAPDDGDVGTRKTAPRASTATRDRHRTASYAAEDQLGRLLRRAGKVDFYGSTLHVPAERHFADIRSMQRYLDRVAALREVGGRWRSLPPVLVRSRKGPRKAHYEYDTGVIAVPLEARWACRETILLHEYAHHLVAVVAPRKLDTEPPHGPTFTATLCHLVEAAIAPEAGLVLRAAYDGAGVPVGTVPRARR